MDEPIVSIIIPVYNVEKYIKNCLESVASQTYKYYEIILVDDGSEDDSIKIAEDVLCGHGLEYQVFKQENAGQGYARNVGLQVAKGEWIYFLDADDVIVPTTIETMVMATFQQKVDIVFCNFEEIYSMDEIREEREVASLYFYEPQQLQEDFLLRKKIVLAPGTLWRKSLLLTYNIMFEKMAWSEDQHFVWRALRYVDKAVYIKKSLYYYMQHEGSIMNSTKAESMIESYHTLCDLEHIYQHNKMLSKYIVPRWIIGTLNSAALSNKYVEWKKIMEQIDGRRKLKVLLEFPNFKVRCSALLGIALPRMYYLIMRYRKQK